MMSMAYASGKQFNVLLFTKSVAWHHTSVLEGVSAIKALSDRHHFSVNWQEDANIFTAKKLAKYDVVIFLQTTGDVLNEEQQQAFETYIQKGKGFVGIHSAADTEHNWLWYKGLVGRTFVIHPAVQTAMIDVTTNHFPGTAELTKRFLWTDEYYHFSKEHSKNLNYLLTVDEKTYSPAAQWGDINVSGMGDFHPLAWYQEYDGGRSFYTALGHLSTVYQEPKFLSHLYGGIYWAATGKGL
mgnify:CR=1 FL=1